MNRGTPWTSTLLLVVSGALLSDAAFSAPAQAQDLRIGFIAPRTGIFSQLGVDMFNSGRPDADRVVESVAELAAAGVTWLAAGVPGETRAEFVDNVARYGAEVLARVRPIEGATWR